jgi:hypothetical protein
MKKLIFLWLALFGFIAIHGQVNDKLRGRIRAGYTPPPDGGPQSTFTSDTIPFSALDTVPMLFRGVEQWHNGDDVNVPFLLTNPTKADAYFRSFYASHVINPTRGTYDWTVIDDDIKAAIDKGQKFGFGFITFFNGADGDYYNTYSGAQAAYPQWVHDSMQSETGTLKDWKTDGTNPCPSCTGNGIYWVPNYNSQYWISFWGQLNKAASAHIATTSYTPATGPWAGVSIPFSKVITMIDVRGYGNYDEWHTAGLIADIDDSPAGTAITAATQKKIIDTVVKYWPTYWVQLMYGVFEAGNTGFANLRNSPEIMSYALKKRMPDGRALGYRRDSWGWTDAYLDEIGKNNDVVYDDGVAPIRADSAILNRYKQAPITGESGGFVQMTPLPDQVRTYKLNSFGNANYGVTQTGASPDSIRLAAKLAGNRVHLVKDSCTVSTTITRDVPFSVSLLWANIGSCPVYENWTVTFELRNASNVSVWSGTSSMALRLFQPPYAGKRRVQDVFTIPGSVSTGNYTLRLVIKDPNGYRPNFLIYNRQPQRQSDGSYIIKSITF